MTEKDENVRDFLATRRARITPEAAGLPPSNGVRRVPGLRREEVAMLSGVSIDYYTRIEKGDLSGVSEEILDAIAGALQLSQDEIRYLYDLARTARRPSRVRPRRRQVATVPERVQQLIDSMATTPVVAHNRYLDVLAANPLGGALFSVIFDSPTRPSRAAPPNLASFVFLDPAADTFYGEPDEAADLCVRILRSQAGRTPHDRRLTELIGELSTRSEDFRERWAAHDVGVHRAGTKTLHHRDVGEVTLAFEELTLDSAPSIILSTYLAEPGSASAERLQILAAWAATAAPAWP